MSCYVNVIYPQHIFFYNDALLLLVKGEGIILHWFKLCGFILCYSMLLKIFTMADISI